MTYTRTTPSPRYAEYVRQSADMHQMGHFRGIGVYKWRKEIRALVRETDAKTLLDYGCGAGDQFRAFDAEKIFQKLHVYAESWAEALGVARVIGYDPACPPYDKFPVGMDGVYASDCLEHIPEEDVGWVIEELFNLAIKFVFATVALFPAKKTFPNGENVHVTLKPKTWWLSHFENAAAKYPTVRWRVEFEEGDSK